MHGKTRGVATREPQWRGPCRQLPSSPPSSAVMFAITTGPQASLERVRGPDDSDLPLKDVSVVHQASREAVHRVLCELWQQEWRSGSHPGGVWAAHGVGRMHGKYSGCRAPPFSCLRSSNTAWLSCAEAMGLRRYRCLAASLESVAAASSTPAAFALLLCARPSPLYCKTQCNAGNQ